MGDSDDEASNRDSKFNFTTFLFGNVDANGELEDKELLDSESQKQLTCLPRLGFSSFINEVISNDDLNIERDFLEEKPNGLNGIKKEDAGSLDGYSIKSPSAIDFSDIAEAVEEEFESIRNHVSHDVDDTDYDSDSLKLSSLPRSSAELKCEKIDEDLQNEKDKKLETPLSAMLPSKYADIDVREIFSDFRFGKVLRFSRLFGPGKPSSLPQIWRGVKKRRKKKKSLKEDSQHFSDSDSDQDTHSRGWSFNYAPPPSVDQIESDDEDKFLKPLEDKVSKETPDSGENSDLGPRAADWRFGPAQVWYDMLEVPETGEGFNYGFKLKPKTEEDASSKQIEPYPDDVFLMVSQLHWEDDVVWNGDDIKHQVMQKLNCKTNAAGWVPSSGNRTAQAFSQPGKGIPPLASVGGVRPGLNQMPPNSKFNMKSQMLMKQQQSQRMDDTTDDTWYSIFPVENEELVYGLWEDEIIWDAEAMTNIPKPKILTLDPNDENIILGVPDDIDPAKQRLGSTTPAKVKIPHPHVKKSKILLGKAGVINVLEEDTPPPPPKSPDRDPFNVSNDSFPLLEGYYGTGEQFVRGVVPFNPYSTWLTLPRKLRRAGGQSRRLSINVGKM